MSSVIPRIELERLLDDDVPHGDLTTEGLGIGALPGVMAFHARSPMILALAEEAAVILEIAGCEVELCAASGDRLAREDLILRAKGPASALLRGSKVAQTLIEVWSGVATTARAMVDAARTVSPDIQVACTRKNIPGTKRYAVAAVKAGGAIMHRLGLSETVLVFPEHLRFLDGVPLAETVKRLRQRAPEKKLVVEVNTIEAAVAAAGAGFDVIQAERFAPGEIAELVARLHALAPSRARSLVAATGGVNVENAAAYARAGADILVTSAPYLGRPCDVQVRIGPQIA